MNKTEAWLRAQARSAAEHAYVPYSQRREAAVLLLSDGMWVPGVRVENASFSLSIPALVNAFSTAVASQRTDVVAVVLSRTFLPEDIAFLRSTPQGAFRPAGDEVFTATDVTSLPAPGDRLVPFLEGPAPAEPASGIALARDVARHAYTPESQFPVGCVLVTDEGRLIPGVNVEHADWSRILCAERNALGTAMTWGQTALSTLYLTCLNDPSGSPCGACRQLLAELAPGARLWMDRGDEPAESTSPQRLLPGAFSGHALFRSA